MTTGTLIEAEAAQKIEVEVIMTGLVQIGVTIRGIEAEEEEMAVVATVVAVVAEDEVIAEEVITEVEVVEVSVTDLCHQPQAFSLVNQYLWRSITSS